MDLYNFIRWAGYYGIALNFFENSLNQVKVNSLMYEKVHILNEVFE